MANWTPVPGATSYRLDVSSSPRFESFVDGYHDLDIGNATGRVVTGLAKGTTYYYRTRAFTAEGTNTTSETRSAATTASRGLVISAAFDRSITSNANAAAIEATINRAIAIYESLFSDPMRVSILFRYANTDVNGTRLQPSNISRSAWVYYVISWDAYLRALITDATTINDANTGLSTYDSMSGSIRPSSAGGRAVGLDTPPAMNANGTVSNGGPYDGIVTINSGSPFQFFRPPSSGKFDAQRAIEHEIDEVLGFGSAINWTSDLRPQDLFSWSAPGQRNYTSSGLRYFSVDGGRTRIVDFNQNSNGDFGDWISPACPQANPYAQNAIGCTGQAADVTATSPEGKNLDAIGYDLADAPAAPPIDVNKDAKTDFVFVRPDTEQTAVWYMRDNVLTGSSYGPDLPAGWNLIDVKDFDHDGWADFVLFNPSTLETKIFYLLNLSEWNEFAGPTLPTGWELITTADFNHDGSPDFVLFKADTRQTAIWYMSDNIMTSGQFGPTLPTGWRLVGVADFNRDRQPDYLLLNDSSRQTAIWYLSGAAFSSGAYGPTIANGYQLIGPGDFNSDGYPDYVLANQTAGKTAIWYLRNNVFSAGRYAPNLPANWNLVLP